MMGGFWTSLANGAYELAERTGWKWPRRVEAWAWHKPVSDGGEDRP